MKLRNTKRKSEHTGSADPEKCIARRARRGRGGRKNTGLDAVEWAEKIFEMGAGEILLTSMDGDGTQNGYDIELTRCISEKVSIPVIASGGAGSLSHIKEAFTLGKSSAALLASLLHDGQLTIREIKEYLIKENLPIRPIE